MTAADLAIIAGLVFAWGTLSARLGKIITDLTKGRGPDSYGRARFVWRAYFP